jgi:hypothetical protein
LNAQLASDGVHLRCGGVGDSRENGAHTRVDSGRDEVLQRRGCECRRPNSTAQQRSDGIVSCGGRRLRGVGGLSVPRRYKPADAATTVDTTTTRAISHIQHLVLRGWVGRLKHRCVDELRSVGAAAVLATNTTR